MSRRGSPPCSVGTIPCHFTEGRHSCCPLPYPSCRNPQPLPWPSTDGLVKPDLSDIYGLDDGVMPRPAYSMHPCVPFEVLGATHEELITHCENVACPGSSATLETGAFCKAITHKHAARRMGPKQRKEICNALLPGPLSWLNCTSGITPLPNQCVFDNLSLCLQACDDPLNAKKDGHRTSKNKCKKVCENQCPRQTRPNCILHCPCKGNKEATEEKTNQETIICVGDDVTPKDAAQFSKCSADCTTYANAATVLSLGARGEVAKGGALDLLALR